MKKFLIGCGAILALLSGVFTPVSAASMRNQNTVSASVDSRVRGSCITVAAALIFNTSTATAARGQVHRGTSVIEAGRANSRINVIIAPSAQSNGWQGLFWVNNGTVTAGACRL